MRKQTIEFPNRRNEREYPRYDQADLGVGNWEGGGGVPRNPPPPRLFQFNTIIYIY